MTEPRAKPVATRKAKTAVVMIHGMGEQIPMQTLRGFVNAVWTTDHSLIDPDRPDTNTGGPRTDNPTWSKPDIRNRSFELHRIATEEARNGRRTDFYEFYWAHLMHGTTWEHLQAWFVGLLFRRPGRVPRNVRAAWLLLWLISLVIAGALLVAALPTDDIRQCLRGECTPSGCDVSALCWTWVSPVVTALLSLGAGWLVNAVLLKYIGDVARYVSARPLNIGRRQEIRDKGVELLETLMGIRDAGSDVPRAEPADDETVAPASGPAADYDRIVVVAHSLGTIVAYDILTHCFARVNRSFKVEPQGKQPERNELETLLRNAVVNPQALSIKEFQERQSACLAEFMAAGSPWIVSDFVTIGSPLTHAEFLLAQDESDLRVQQAERILPTCPPVLEWDQTTERDHFSYWAGKRRAEDDDAEAVHTRIPHHAAHFAYTRWTNLYSPAKAIFWGDLVSGPVAEHFGLRVTNGRIVKGIRDIQVLPAGDAGRPRRTPFLTHTKYWSLQGDAGEEAPDHIRALRNALDLNRA